MRFPRGFADDVKNQGDIVRVVSDYVTLRKRGANYIAICPFHSEKTPSFSVHQGKGLFKCFGCGVGGGIFDFVMRIEGCGFPESVRIVAEKCGIPIPAVEETEDHKKIAQTRENVLRLNEWAAEYFENQLMDPSGAGAREYIQTRGVSEDTRKLFRIGFAPDRWDGLTTHLRDLGATTDEMDSSGLAKLGDTGGLHDRFRARVMFPITDSQGRVIAFGGRVMGDGEPKYMNSPETAVYTKGRNLYGLALAKNEIRSLGFAILVEGYLDCIIPYQAGIVNVVASLGTALTDSQVRLLRRYMDQPQIVVNFDPDTAGQAATMRSIEMLLVEGFKVNILRVPSDEDPDEFVRAHGASGFRALLKTTQPYIEYIVDKAVLDHDISRPAGKVEALNAILPHLARMRDRVARSDYAGQIAKRINLDSDLVRQEWVKLAVRGGRSVDPGRLRLAQDMTLTERRLLEVILANADVRKSIVSNLREEDFEGLSTREVFSALVTMEAEGIVPSYENLCERLENESQHALVSTLLMSDLWWISNHDFDALFATATELLVALRNDLLEKRLDALQTELAQAERENDEARWLSLFQQKTEIKKRKLALSATSSES